MIYNSCAYGIYVYMYKELVATATMHIMEEKASTQRKPKNCSVQLEIITKKPEKGKSRLKIAIPPQKRNPNNSRS